MQKEVTSAFVLCYGGCK